MKTERQTKSSGIRLGITTRLSAIFLFLAIVPMLILAFYNLSQSRREIVEVVQENLLELSHGTAKSINYLLLENQRTSATLSLDPTVVAFLAASEEERIALTPRVYQVLQNYADTHPDHDAPGLLDTNGIVIASLENILLGKDRSFRDYFQVSIQGDPYVSDILVGRATGRPGIFLTHPVITVDGNIVGIDIVWLKADVIEEIIADVSIGSGGNAYIIDQDGVIIVHPDSNLLYHSLTDLSPEAIAVISETIRFGTAEGSDQPLIPTNLCLDDLAFALVDSQSGIQSYYSPFDKCEHVVGFTRLESFPWTVVVDLPEARFLAPFQKLQIVTWVSAGVLVAIVLIVSLLLARGITYPIRLLATAIRAIERNESLDLSNLKEVTSRRDEIAHLGRAFTEMVKSIRRESASRKKAEEALKKAHNELEIRVEERTAELQTVNRELEAFTYSVSHDLRAPLRSLDGFSRILLEDYQKKLDKQGKHYLQRVRAGAQNMAQLIDNLLNLSRIGRERMKVEPVDMEIIAREIYLALEDEKKDRKIKFTVLECPVVSADSHLIKIALSNLLSNALKFTRGKSPAVIEFGSETTDGLTVFHVRDNGIGFDMKYINKLFSPFQRLHGADEFEGSGIGLAIVLRIINRHGGKIWAESSPDSGATFYFRLQGSKS